ncbi:low-density lipoprotein receptor-related protein 2-like [Planococcus citri]|uniref:low-density lipoprotein receptor-related protein 2-like n=1 Tax=Planococcus citri TaxID=170843 RepID=UPI0031F92471
MRFQCDISEFFCVTLIFSCYIAIGYSNSTVVSKFLLYSTKHYIKSRVFNSTSEGFSDFIPPIFSKKARFVGVDFDFQNDYIYYSDVQNDFIYRTRRNETGKEMVTNFDHENSENLAVDWVANNIYFFDSRKGTLNVISTRNFTNRNVLLKNLKRPRGIAVHPSRGFVFISEWERPANISRIYTDGTNLMIFRNVTLGWPNGLAIDFAVDRLYWCDALLTNIKHSNLDGTDVQTINSVFIKQPYSITIHLDSIYFTDWRTNSIIRLNKLNGSMEEEVTKEPKDERIYCVKVYSHAEHNASENHPCLANNNYGGCQKLCFGVPSDTSADLQVKCGCPYGEKLADDERECIPDPSAEPETQKFCFNSTTFVCSTNQKCISKSFKCDGENDCGDNSDEAGCSDDANKLKDRNECHKWNHCDQLCENTKDSYTCSCYPGFDLVENKNCVVNNTATPYDIYFANDGSISKINSLSQNRTLVLPYSSVNGLDYHFDKNLLFWISFRTKKIHYQDLKNSTTTNSSSSSAIKGEFELPTSLSPEAVAVDWIGNNLYVVDSLGQKVDIFELHGRYHTIVMSRMLTEPKDIALDPLSGLMFLADGRQIFRAHMDGTNAESIVTKNVSLATGIAVDSFGKRVFWCDSLLDYIIETADYQGNNRFLISKVPSSKKLAVFENYIFWPDGKEHGVMSMNKYKGSSSIQAVFKNEDISDLKSIKIVHSLQQRAGQNPCGINNGGCHHMCVVTKLNESDALGYRCACNIGYALSNDTKTCIVVSEFLLYSRDRHIKSRLLNQTLEGFSDAISPVISKSARYVGLDFDFQDDYIYYSELFHDFIYRAHKNGTGKEIVLASQNEGTTENLAVDWMAKNLYYFNTVKGTLNVLSTRNFTNRKVLLKNLKRPRGIVVHPNRGLIFISEWDKSANISRMHTDGTNLMVFRNLTLGWPNGLAIDFAVDRLYWCDALLKHVQHSNLDGTDVKTINSDLIKKPFSIAIHQDWMYITEWKLNAIIKLHKLHGKIEEVTKELQEGRVNVVKVYSQNEQDISKSHPCLASNNYGGCQKLCFGVPSNSFTELQVKCGCPHGENLADNEHECIPDPSAEPEITVCPDSEDFVCDNQHCVLHRFKCDGDNDCGDNSDETSCT